MMAKNIIQKKKRIAHNKYAPDNLIFRSKNRCLDFADKIKNDTDRNLISKNLTAPADSAANRKGITQKEYLEGKSQNQPRSTYIFKDNRRIDLDKKFPLMEKSQKIMKHLEHNRKVPKPRAHLASLPQSPACVDTKKSETRKKNSSNSKKTESSPKESVTTNITSNTRDNVKKSESNRKEKNSRKVSLNESVTNKTSSTRDNVKKFETSRKRNNSKKLSHHESGTTNQISSRLRSSKVNRLEERNKNKKVIEKIKTVVAKKCFNKGHCSSVNDIPDDIRDSCSGSEASDSDFEKFVQTQKKESNLKKRKKQPATDQKKTKQKSSIQKQKDVGKGAKVKSSSQYDSDSVIRSSKRRRVSNKSTKHESTDKESEKNFSPRSEDEFYSEGNDFCDNDVCTGDSSDDERVLNLPNTVSTEPKSDEQYVTSKENSLEVKDAYSRDSSFIYETVLNTKDNDSIVSKLKNEQVLTKVKSLRVTNDLGVNELSATHHGAMLNTISSAKDLVPESAESLVLIDLCLSDNECEPTNSIPQVSSTKKSEVKNEVIHNLPNTFNSQSDDESDLAIVDVVLSHEKLGKFKDNKRRTKTVNGYRSTNELNIKIEKSTSLELNKTQNPQKILHMQKRETILKHEAAFSTDIRHKPAEADFSSTPVINNDNVIINKREIKKTFDDDIIVLSDQKASTTFLHSSQISPVASSSTNVKHEISALKRENPIENVTNAEESVPSKEKLLYEIACFNVKTLIPNDKPTKFSSLSVDDMNKMDATTLLKMFKAEFQTYQEIIKTQESIGYTFKLLENRQAEKVLSLKAAIKKYMESFECNGINSLNVDFPFGKD